MMRSGPQEVVAGVYMVGGPHLTDPSDCLVYGVDGGSEAALIDCGAGGDVGGILNNLAQAVGEKPLTTVILTHCHVDHIGGLPGLLARGTPRVIGHAQDAPAVREPDPRRTGASWYGVDLPRMRVDYELSGGEERIAVGNASLTCVHTPGHTPGSISIILETAHGRILFGQDIHGPFFKEFGSDMEQWASSMKRLLALNADVLCEGHFGVIRPKEAVQRFIQQFLDQHGYG